MITTLNHQQDHPYDILLTSWAVHRLRRGGCGWGWKYELLSSYVHLGLLHRVRAKKGLNSSKCFLVCYSTYPTIEHYGTLFVCLSLENPRMFDRIKVLSRKLVKLAFTTLTNLNIFPLRNFGIRVDRRKAIYLAKITTRFYIVLLIVSIVILALYTAIRPRIVTKVFVKPTFNVYSNLLSYHSNTLQCRCSYISSTYDHFVKIEPAFHQVNMEKRVSSFSNACS